MKSSWHALAIWLLLAFACSAEMRPARPELSVESAKNFCLNGIDPGALASKPTNLRIWGSYCADGPPATGELKTSAFRAPGYLSLYLAGNPTFPKVGLWIERVSDGERLAVSPYKPPPFKGWVLYDFALPFYWRGEMIRFVAEDQNTDPGGYFAFSEPLIGPNPSGFGEAVQLFLRTLEHFILLMLPGFAAAAAAIWKGVRSTVKAGLVMLAAVSLPGYLIFWIWFLVPSVGRLSAIAVVVASLALLIYALRNMDAECRQLLKTLVAPVLLVGCATLLVLSSGFLFGGLETPFDTAAARFSHRLPIDNQLPFLLSEGISVRHVPKPLVIDWRSSDRPPLQTGIALSQYPFIFHSRDLDYSITAAIAQSLWIFAVWLLLTACAVCGRLIALILATTYFSGFVFINTFFVWPKLLAAAYVIGFFAVIFTEWGTEELRRGGMLFVLTTSVLLTAGMLSHGGSVFAVFGAGLALLAMRKYMPLKALIQVAALAFALYLPWVLYQRFYDPPGDRLLKMHMAGVDLVDSRTFSQALVDAYKGVTITEFVESKAHNVQALVGHGQEYWRAIGRLLFDFGTRGLRESTRLGQQAEDIRALLFFYFVPNLGFLTAGLFALVAGMAKRYRSAEWNVSVRFWLLIGGSLLVWCVLMLRPTIIIIHAGTYAVNLLAVAASLLALWAVSSRAAWLIGGAQIAINILLYVVLMRQPQPGGTLREGIMRPWQLALSCCCLMAVLALLRELSRSKGSIQCEPWERAKRLSNSAGASA